ncbi:MAG: ABC transporter permease [Pirellulales bacterium]|nr:ABC transporter permease [Pirellulales bacterium]
MTAPPTSTPTPPSPGATAPSTEAANLAPLVPGPVHRVGSDVPFLAALVLLGGFYVVLIAATLAADALFTSPAAIAAALRSPEIRYATMLSLVSSCVTTVLSLWVAVPIGYLLSRYRFPGKLIIDALLDIPIVLPPLVIGLSLLILFRTPPGHWLEALFTEATRPLAAWGLIDRPVGITFEIPSVVLAQFMVAAAFAVRTLRTAFDEITPRKEQVAQTLGCTRSQAFWMVVLPEARSGVLAAATLTWARAIGEFGPILVFSGATRMKTEVLPTTVFLELSIGDIEAAVAVSLLMVLMALVVLVVVRFLGRGDLLRRALR